MINNDGMKTTTPRKQNHFKIETNVPVPPLSGGARPKYPFREMKIGDSFFASNEDAKVISVRVSAHTFGRRNKEYRFTVVKESGGCRVWRIPTD